MITYDKAKEHGMMIKKIEEFPTPIKQTANVKGLKDAESDIKKCENDLIKKKKDQDNAILKLQELGQH